MEWLEIATLELFQKHDTNLIPDTGIKIVVTNHGIEVFSTTLNHRNSIAGKIESIGSTYRRLKEFNDAIIKFHLSDDDVLNLIRETNQGRYNSLLKLLKMQGRDNTTGAKNAHSYPFMEDIFRWYYKYCD